MGTMVYAASQYLTFYALFAISSLFFLIAGLVTKLDLVAKTEFSVLVITFLVWGFAQISLAFFFASFFSKSRSALGNFYNSFESIHIFENSYRIFDCFMWSYHWICYRTTF